MDYKQFRLEIRFGEGLRDGFLSVQNYDSRIPRAYLLHEWRSFYNAALEALLQAIRSMPDKWESPLYVTKFQGLDGQLTQIPFGEFKFADGLWVNEHGVARFNNLRFNV